VREWLSTLRNAEDLVNVGAYVAGSNPKIDEALARRDSITSYLRQPADAPCNSASSLQSLMAV